MIVMILRLICGETVTRGTIGFFLLLVSVILRFFGVTRILKYVSIPGIPFQDDFSVLGTYC
jgi:hypothetical protein